MEQGAGQRMGQTERRNGGTALRRPIRNILFITWDSPETQYLERLFLPIFAGLATHGFRFHVLQFSWGLDGVVERRADLCAAQGIAYRNVVVLRRLGGAGAFLSAMRGARAIRKAVADWEIDTLMPRSLMPALAVLRMGRAGREGLALVFDADGLPADERVDFAGLSPHGATYRILRDIEAEALRSADAVLSRTEAARSILLARAGAGLAAERCHVVSNGVDPSPFAQAAGPRVGTERKGFVLCYCGSIGPQYRLADMIATAQRLKLAMPDLRFLLLSPAEAEIRAALARVGLSDCGWIEAKRLEAEAIPAALMECDLGIALRQPAFSTRAVLPIKIGEYLLAGLPVIGTPGVGESAALEAAGVFRSAEAADLEQTIAWIVDEVRPGAAAYRERCHAIGLQRFAVAATVEQYREALVRCDAGRMGGRA